MIRLLYLILIICKLSYNNMRTYWHVVQIAVQTIKYRTNQAVSRFLELSQIKNETFNMIG